MNEHDQLQAAVAALESQRALLGDAVVDTALASMRQRLGALLAQAEAAPPEQALRQVSVLFLDVVGSTALSGLLDAEDVHEVIDGLLAACSQRVQEHGGRVLQYAGDNLLAAFGADRAQEDDAERAVACGLVLLAEGRALRQRVRQAHGHDGCDVRVGIHTGPVLLGGGVDEEASIRGLTVNIAARMEQSAPEGTLRVSHDTWLLVRGAFEAQAQAPLRVKGSEQALLTYLVQRARPATQRLIAHGLDGEPAPLVGRKEELTRLLALPGDAAQSQQLRALTLIGEPGVGKSRLLREFQAQLHEVPGGVWLLLGRAHPPSRLQPYGLLRNLLAWRLQIADSDTLDQAKTRWVSGLQPWLGEGGQAKAQLMGQLLGLDFSDQAATQGLEPSALRQRAFAALQDYLRALGQQGQLPMLLLEDLHWADDGSLDFLAELLHDPNAPALALLATARPELAQRRADWGATDGHPSTAQHSVLHLQALPPSHSQTLAGALLQQVGEGAGALQARLVALADGNPFFMEELVRMCIDQGVIVPGTTTLWRVLPDKLASTHMPTTVVGVLQARLDALPAAQRLALQQASIVGHVFWDQALAALDPAAPLALPELVRHQLIEPRAKSAFQDTPEEAFRHHLLQQAAYDTVLKPARQAGHAAAAAWLSQRMGDRSAEFLATTAQHYERAGNLTQAADFYERATRDATARFVPAVALAQAEQALRCVGQVPSPRRFELHGLRMAAADMLGLRAVQAAEVRARQEVAQALGDEALLALAVMDEALLASRQADEARALALAQRAADLAASSGAVIAGAMAQAQLAWSRYTLGELDAAVLLAARAVADARQALAQDGGLANRTLLVKVLTLQSIVLRGSGAHRLATAANAQALQMAQADGLRISQVSLREGLASAQADAGRYASALQHFQACLALATEVHWVISIVSSHYNIARCYREMGEPGQARQSAHTALDLARKTAQREIAGRSDLLLAHLDADAHHFESAQAHYAASAEAFEASQLPHFASQAYAGLAALALTQGQLDRAQEWAERVQAVLCTELSLLIIDDPVWPPLVCYRVWSRCGDARAASALARAWRDLQTLAERADDEQYSHDLRHRVRLHRDVQAAWAATAASRA
jgi:predicted ATPase/class 3 adenylate cyclase